MYFPAPLGRSIRGPRATAALVVLGAIDYEPTFRELRQSKVEQIVCGGWVISATAELRNLGAS